jgi:trigger factor
MNEVISTAELKLDQAKVQVRFEELAQQFPDAMQAVQQYRSNPQILRQMEAGVLEDQVVEWLVERAKITEKPSSFKEIMNFGA